MVRLRLIFLLLFIAISEIALPASPLARQGVLDLRAWDFSRDGHLSLDGEWRFYWKQLIAPHLFHQNEDLAQLGDFIPVPKEWNHIQLQGKPLSGNGYATYYLRILLKNAPSVLAVKMLDMGSAYTLYINGKKILSNGRVGKSREDMVAQWLPLAASFAVNESELHIVMHISNFNHKNGGAWFPILLGEEPVLSRMRLKNIAIELFVAGLLTVMGVYHLGLFLLRRKESAPLFFSLFTLCLALRVLTTGEKYLIYLLPDLNWSFAVKMEYASFYASIPAFAIFLQRVFPLEFPSRFLKIIVSIGLLFTLIVLILPVGIFSYSLIFYQFFTMLVGFYATGVIIRSFVKKRDGSILFLIGWSIFFLTVINDIFYYMHIFTRIPLLSLGTFLFLIFLALVLSTRISRTITRTERMKSHLEAEIERRIRSLQESEFGGQVIHVNKQEELSELERFLTGLKQWKSVDELLDRIFTFVQKRYQIEAVWLWMIEAGKNELHTIRFAGGHHFSQETRKLIQNMRVPLSESAGTTWRTYTRQKPVFLPRLARSRFSPVEAIIVQTLNVVSLVQLPVVHQGESLAILNMATFNHHATLQRKELPLLMDISTHLADTLMERFG